MFTYIGLEAIVARAREGLKAGVALSADELRDDVEDAAPEEGGALKGTVRVEGGRSSAGAASASASKRVVAGGGAAFYAVMVHEGTGPHGIEPRDDGALQVGGAVVEHVDHPGATANKFVERPLIAHRPRHLATVARACRRAL